MELPEILEKYPNSNYTKYKDWYEINFRLWDEPGCLKVSGTIEQVKYFINIIIEKYGKS